MLESERRWKESDGNEVDRGAETGGSEDILRADAGLESRRVGAGLVKTRGALDDGKHEDARRGTEAGILRSIFVVVLPGQVYMYMCMCMYTSKVII